MSWTGRKFCICGNLISLPTIQHCSGKHQPFGSLHIYTFNVFCWKYIFCSVAESSNIPLYPVSSRRKEGLYSLTPTLHVGRAVRLMLAKRLWEEMACGWITSLIVWNVLTLSLLQWSGRWLHVTWGMENENCSGGLPGPPEDLHKWETGFLLS